MQRLSALLLLLLLCWQIAGWQVMRLLCFTQPDTGLFTALRKTHAAKPLQIIAIADNETHLLNWTKPGREFVFNGQWYDVEQQERRNGITYYHCTADAPDTHWAREMEKLMAGSNTENRQLPLGNGGWERFLGKVFFAPALYDGHSLPQSCIQPSGYGVLPSPVSAIMPDVPTPPPKLVL